MLVACNSVFGIDETRPLPDGGIDSDDDGWVDDFDNCPAQRTRTRRTTTATTSGMSALRMIEVPSGNYCICSLGYEARDPSQVLISLREAPAIECLVGDEPGDPSAAAFSSST